MLPLLLLLLAMLPLLLLLCMLFPPLGLPSFLCGVSPAALILRHRMVVAAAHVQGALCSKNRSAAPAWVMTLA